MSGEAGKGSKRRPTDPQKYRDNWEAIFKKKTTERKTMNNYKLVRAADGITWVSLEPLAYDVNTMLQAIMDVPLDDLDSTTRDELNFRIHGLRAVHAFIAALITEQNVAELREKNETVH